MRTMRSLAAVSTALLLALGATACSGDSSDPGGGDTTTLTVYAAASLTTTFQRIGQGFEADHPGVAVDFNFAGSSDLVSQLQQGAPADVLATADTATMDDAVGDDLVSGDPRPFASNTLEIATPPGNPAGVTSFADLAKPGVDVVVCAPEVPCGAATQQVEQAAGVTLKPVSEEQSVTDVLGKVTSGEADAGLVYVTDVEAAGDQVVGVPFAESSAAVNTYPIATLADASQSALAQEFVDLVLASGGQSILRSAGFAKP